MEDPQLQNACGLKTLSELLAHEVQRLDRESTRHKRLHRRCQTALIGLTACTTVVAGAGLVVPAAASGVAQFVVLCLTATGSAVAAWSAMRRTRELWEHERGIYYELLDVQRALSFQAACGPLSERDLQRFFTRIAAALRSSGPRWAQILAGQDKALARTAEGRPDCKPAPPPAPPIVERD